jgi:hypothetical protein
MNTYDGILLLIFCRKVAKAGKADDEPLRLVFCRKVTKATKTGFGTFVVISCRKVAKATKDELYEGDGTGIEPALDTRCCAVLKDVVVAMARSILDEDGIEGCFYEICVKSIVDVVEMMISRKGGGLRRQERSKASGWKMALRLLSIGPPIETTT